MSSKNLQQVTSKPGFSGVNQQEVLFQRRQELLPQTETLHFNPERQVRSGTAHLDSAHKTPNLVLPAPTWTRIRKRRRQQRRSVKSKLKKKLVFRTQEISDLWSESAPDTGLHGSGSPCRTSDPYICTLQPKVPPPGYCWYLHEKPSSHSQFSMFQM